MIWQVKNRSNGRIRNRSLRLAQGPVFVLAVNEMHGGRVKMGGVVKSYFELSYQYFSRVRAKGEGFDRIFHIKGGWQGE